MPSSAAVLVTLFLVLPVAALFLLLSRFVRLLRRRRGSWIDRPRVVISAAGALAFCAAWFAYARFVEPGWVETTRTDIRTRRAPLGQARFRILHLSDLHLDGPPDPAILEIVRRERPDLIVLTGDYLNTDEASGDLIAFLRGLRAPYGVYAVPGHWDRKWPTHEYFRAGGVRLLVDESVTISAGTSVLQIAGLDSRPNRTPRELAAEVPSAGFRILLAHDPGAADGLAALPPEARYDLFLCGHTHGGQVRLPGLGEAQGRHDTHGTPMYVNRGVGMTGGGVPRVRFLCRPEVAVIELSVAGPGVTLGFMS